LYTHLPIESTGLFPVSSVFKDALSNFKSILPLLLRKCSNYNKCIIPRHIERNQHL
jgi:hypothetical protein